MASTTQSTTPVVATLGRLTWMLFGPFLLLLTTVGIFRSKVLFNSLDIAFVAILVGMILGRWVEFKSGIALTAQGTPMTAGHLRNYMLVTGAVGGTLWLTSMVVRGLL